MFNTRTKRHFFAKKGPFRIMVCTIILWPFLFNIFSYDLARAAETPSEFTGVDSERAGSPGSSLAIGTPFDDEDPEDSDGTFEQWVREKAYAMGGPPQTAYEMPSAGTDAGQLHAGEMLYDFVPVYRVDHEMRYREDRPIVIGLGGKLCANIARAGDGGGFYLAIINETGKGISARFYFKESISLERDEKTSMLKVKADSSDTNLTSIYADDSISPDRHVVITTDADNANVIDIKNPNNRDVSVGQFPEYKLITSVEGEAAQVDHSGGEGLYSTWQLPGRGYAVTDTDGYLFSDARARVYPSVRAIESAMKTWLAEAGQRKSALDSAIKKGVSDGDLKVLYLCAHNLNRSSSMHGITQDFVEANGLREKVTVLSAGTLNRNMPRELGVKWESLGSVVLDRGISVDEIKAANIIIVAEEAHKEFLIRRLPEIEHNIFLFNELQPIGSHFYGRSVPDEGGIGEYIRSVLEAHFFPQLLQANPGAPPTAPSVNIGDLSDYDVDNRIKELIRRNPVAAPREKVTEILCRKGGFAEYEVEYDKKDPLNTRKKRTPMRQIKGREAGNIRQALSAAGIRPAWARIGIVPSEEVAIITGASLESSSIVHSGGRIWFPRDLAEHLFEDPLDEEGGNLLADILRHEDSHRREPGADIHARDPDGYNNLAIRAGRVRREINRAKSAPSEEDLGDATVAFRLMNSMLSTAFKAEENINLMITFKCHFGCDHCLGKEALKAGGNRDADKKMLYSLIDQLKGFEKMHIVGTGEPLEYGKEKWLSGGASGEFVELVNYAASKIQEVRIVTNGYLVPDNEEEAKKFFSQFRGNVVWVLSIDKFHEEKMKKRTGRSLKEISMVMDKLDKKGVIKTAINMRKEPHEAEFDLLYLYGLQDKYGRDPDNVFVNNVLAQGSALVNIVGALDLKPYDIKRHAWDPEKFFPFIDPDGYFLTSDYVAYLAPSERTTAGPFGFEISPADGEYLNLGNVNDTPLADIIISKLLMRNFFLRSRPPGVLALRDRLFPNDRFSPELGCLVKAICCYRAGNIERAREIAGGIDISASAVKDSVIDIIDFFAMFAPFIDIKAFVRDCLDYRNIGVENGPNLLEILETLEMGNIKLRGYLQTRILKNGSLSEPDHLTGAWVRNPDPAGAVAYCPVYGVYSLRMGDVLYPDRYRGWRSVNWYEAPGGRFMSFKRFESIENALSEFFEKCEFAKRGLMLPPLGLVTEERREGEECYLIEEQPGPNELRHTLFNRKVSDISRRQDTVGDIESLGAFAAKIDNQAVKLDLSHTHPVRLNDGRWVLGDVRACTSNGATMSAKEVFSGQLIEHADSISNIAHNDWPENNDDRLALIKRTFERGYYSALDSAEEIEGRRLRVKLDKVIQRQDPFRPYSPEALLEFVKTDLGYGSTYGENIVERGDLSLNLESPTVGSVAEALKAASHILPPETAKRVEKEIRPPDIDTTPPDGPPPAAAPAEGSPAQYLETIRDHLLEQALGDGFDVEKDLRPLRLHKEDDQRQNKRWKRGDKFSWTTVYYREVKVLEELGILALKDGKCKFSNMVIGPDEAYTTALIDVVNGVTVGKKKPPLQRGEIPEDERPLVKEILKLHIINYIHANVKEKARDTNEPRIINIWQDYGTKAQGAGFPEIENSSRESSLQINFEESIENLVELACNNVNDNIVTILPLSKLTQRQADRLTEAKARVIYVDIAPSRETWYSYQIDGLIATGRAYLNDDEASFYKLYELLTQDTNYTRIALSRLKESPLLFLHELNFILRPIIAGSYEDMRQINRRMERLLQAV